MLEDFKGFRVSGLRFRGRWFGGGFCSGVFRLRPENPQPATIAVQPEALNPTP